MVHCLIQVREASNHSHHQFSPSVRQAQRQAWGIGERLRCRSGMVCRWAPVRKTAAGKHAECNRRLHTGACGERLNA